jgi:hypothetical protein
LALTRAAPLPVRLVAEAEIYYPRFEPLKLPTHHIETLVLGNIYVEIDGEDYIPDDIAYHPSVQKMKLPGLKKIEVVGHDLPLDYILAFFDAIHYRKFPSVSLWMRNRHKIDLVKLVRNPLFRKLHTIDINTGETADHLSKNRLTSLLRNFS